MVIWKFEYCHHGKRRGWNEKGIIFFSKHKNTNTLLVSIILGLLVFSLTIYPLFFSYSHPTFTLAVHTTTINVQKLVGNLSPFSPAQIPPILSTRILAKRPRLSNFDHLSKFEKGCGISHILTGSVAHPARLPPHPQTRMGPRPLLYGYPPYLELHVVNASAILVAAPIFVCHSILTYLRYASDSQLPCSFMTSAGTPHSNVKVAPLERKLCPEYSFRLIPASTRHFLSLFMRHRLSALPGVDTECWISAAPLVPASVC